MPDTSLPISWKQATLQLEARLRERMGQVPECLDAHTIKNCYPNRQYVGGWRVYVEFTDKITRGIDVVASSGFPSTPVRTALVDHPPLLTWPHVESDGILCLLPEMAEWDPDDPCAVAVNLLDRSIRLIEELIEGSIIERDFREEFLTYWAYKPHEAGERFFSLLTPEPPSRNVQVWRNGEFEIVGEDAKSLAQWVRRRFGNKVKTQTEKAAFIWLPQPPLPADFPETAGELLSLADGAGQDAIEVLAKTASDEPDQILAVLGAIGRGGPGLIAVKVPNPKYMNSLPHSIADPLSKGFRPGHTPKSVLVDRYFGANSVIRSLVQRADSNWVHGRGRDPRTERLLASTVVLFGCGSVGAPVACALAQAGAGRIILVDYDDLSWPNVGRHPLGGSAVGHNKAKSLAKRLQADFPHLQIESRDCYLQDLLQSEQELMEGADLIISAIGNWGAESQLNRWHIEQYRAKPIVYCWTEAHACAGHAVTIIGEGGCFQCQIGRTGSPSFKVVEWPEGGNGSLEEPACGAFYHPYGPIELSFITAMISDVALDCLLNPPSHSVNRIFATTKRRIEELGGQWSNEWEVESSEETVGMRILEWPWLGTNCFACRDQTANEAA